MIGFILKIQISFFLVFVLGACQTRTRLSNVKEDSSHPQKNYQAKYVGKGSFSHTYKLSLPLAHNHQSENLLIKVLNESSGSTAHAQQIENSVVQNQLFHSLEEADKMKQLYDLIKDQAKSELGYVPMPEPISNWQNFDISPEDSLLLPGKEEPLPLIDFLSSHLTMSYIEGQSLAEIAPQLSIDQIKVITAQLLNIEKLFLKHCYVHFDLKPQNIIIRLKDDQSPESYIIDFGVGHFFEDPEYPGDCSAYSRENDAQVFSPVFASLSHTGIDNYFLSDIRSLASIIYFMVFDKSIDPSQTVLSSNIDIPANYNLMLNLYLFDQTKAFDQSSDSEKFFNLVYMMHCRKEDDLMANGEEHLPIRAFKVIKMVEEALGKWNDYNFAPKDWDIQSCEIMFIEPNK